MNTDNQQRSLINQGVQFITRTEKRNNKWYGLYLCPSCNNEIELRIDTVTTHYKKYSYPKFCSACGNKNAGNKRIKHGDINTRLYSIWKNMLSRTAESSKHKAYKNVFVCEEWKTFINFKEWALNSGYKDNLSIDRINSKDNYYPLNCRWITIAENTRRASIRSNNNTNTKITTEQAKEIIRLYDSKQYTHQELSDMYKVGRTTIGYIINKERSTTIS